MDSNVFQTSLMNARNMSRWVNGACGVAGVVSGVEVPEAGIEAGGVTTGLVGSAGVVVGVAGVSVVGKEEPGVPFCPPDGVWAGFWDVSGVVVVLGCVRIGAGLSSPDFSAPQS